MLYEPMVPSTFLIRVVLGRGAREELERFGPSCSGLTSWRLSLVICSLSLVVCWSMKALERIKYEAVVVAWIAWSPWLI